ncbi:GntR family transcriptional regulator [Cereibacter sphaeroides]|uniref:GntR family transcriptional regulator n=1 Tax=Rhodobacterales TaxID=204455 RepID=UPI000BBF03C7|nr:MULTISPECIES: GntR family transcriptional regulator [Paracoccaceae]MCE6958023.1 GntR family transcriptional regulator [Cereibacter sphaeroides]MCE6971958.1 GntR family transcriptional regulator [Cereibacter sphaeroides]
MGDAGRFPADDLPISPIRKVSLPSLADQVFDALRDRILTLELPPGTRLSEAGVASRMGVSRQPVREAFGRLAKLGFLQIRPQSGTTVSLISQSAVLQARFIRAALEVQTCRTACEAIDQTGIRDLRLLLDQQKAAVEANDRKAFHALDDQFHRDICIRSGVGYVWDLIHDNKAHMDRVRMLSLNSPTQRQALNEHTVLLDAIEARDPEAATAAITTHLSRILVQIERLKAEQHDWFTDTAG